MQGACCIGKPVAFSTVKRWYSFVRAHIEPMEGSPQQSKDYCTKQDKDNYFEKGQMPAPGTRTDLSELAERVLRGDTLREIARSDPASIIRYHKGLTVLRRYAQEPRDYNKRPTVVWIYGKTGTGKSMSAVQAAERLYGKGMYWMSCGTLQWFDGYDGHPCAILDDLRTKHTTFDFLLRLLDVYPFKTPVKGDFAEWVPELIFVTCPWDPRDLWSLRTPEQLDQLSRRVGYTIKAPEGIERVHKMRRADDGSIVVPELPEGNDGTLGSGRNSPRHGHDNNVRLLYRDPVRVETVDLRCDSSLDEDTIEFLEAGASTF